MTIIMIREYSGQRIHGGASLSTQAVGRGGRVCPGLNNRNLKTFEVSLETSKQLAEDIPDDFVKVSESGISSTVAIKSLKPYGYEGFLIGENFMKTNTPGIAAADFIKTLTLWN